MDAERIERVAQDLQQMTAEELVAIVGRLLFLTSLPAAQAIVASLQCAVADPGRAQAQVPPGQLYLAPYVALDGTMDLSRVDGGAANWADIRGNEGYVLAGQRGFTIGLWGYCNAVVATEYFASKWDATGAQRGRRLA